MLADTFKERGNKALKMGRKLWDEAIAWYSKAIDAKSPIASQNSLCFSNRAHVHLLKGNFGHAAKDSSRALEFDPTNIKAAYRYGRGRRGERDAHLPPCSQSATVC